MRSTVVVDGDAALGPAQVRPPDPRAVRREDVRPDDGTRQPLHGKPQPQPCLGWGVDEPLRVGERTCEGPHATPPARCREGGLQVVRRDAVAQHLAQSVVGEQRVGQDDPLLVDGVDAPACGAPLVDQRWSERRPVVEPRPHGGCHRQPVPTAHVLRPQALVRHDER
ncbi:hypothetical protein ACFT5B_11885 [Luteimicrobium sp. NPDC057192]|uniref:hypothetical protein n=1 Tax=Luteimicrobium sp. NPDC057192 TaxID=3346042 RepID=UPI00362E1470